MAENSPTRVKVTARNHALRHPYDRAKLKAPRNMHDTENVDRDTGKKYLANDIVNQKKRVALTEINHSNFSFSNGSSSLFPCVKGVERAWKIHEDGTIEKKGGTISPIEKTVKNTTTNENVEVSTSKPLGAIGSKRQRKNGFIPVDSSCTLSCNEILPRTSDSILGSNLFGVSSATTSPEAIITSGFKGSASSSSDDSDKENVAVGQAALQKKEQRGLNTSFCDKFDRLLPLDEFKVGCKSKILTERDERWDDFSEYTQETLKHWLCIEGKIRPEEDYMALQNEITHKMRSILMDWIAEVCDEFDMLEETFHLCASLIDRFLSAMNVSKNRFQLLGITCLFIAAKYEQISAPEISDFVYITDETYTKRDILKMENIVLGILDYELMVPTVQDFVNLFCHQMKVSPRIRHLSHYLASLSLLSGEVYLGVLPSMLAAACIVVARYSIERVIWDDLSESVLPYGSISLTKICKNLITTFYEAFGADSNSIRDRYGNVKFSCASKTFVPAQLPPIML